MKKQNAETSEKTKSSLIQSRRNIIKGAAAVVMGGIAGRMSNAYAASQPEYAPAPPLPWKWTKLDPMEAGTRAYENYLKNKG